MIKRAIALCLTVGTLILHTGAASAGPVTPNADLQGTISADRDVASVGETITYTVQAYNTGPDSVRQVWVDLSVSDNATFASADATSGSCRSAETIRCELGTMRPETSATITWTVTTTAEGYVSGGFYMASDQFANEPTRENNWGNVAVYVHDGGASDVIEVGCSTTLGATRAGSWWENPFTCTSSGYISSPSTATLEILPGANFTGSAYVWLYRSQSDWSDPYFSESFSRSFVAGVPTSSDGNSLTVDLPASGFYVLQVAPSMTRSDTDRRVCVPLRPICVGNEDSSYTYKSTSDGDFGARVEVTGTTL